MKRKYTIACIAYAYETSMIAKYLGFEKTGCYYVEETVVREDGSIGTSFAQGCKGFADKNDPDLVAMLKEYRAS